MSSLDLQSIDWQKLAQGYLQQKLAESVSSYNIRPNYPRLPQSLQLRDYQRQAVANWLRHRGRGTLKMATGSGKTITALAIATELYRQINLQVLLVICPYRHLVSQWAKECQRFNLNPILAFESVYNWQNDLAGQLYGVLAQQQPFLTIITTNSTFISEGFQSQLGFFPDRSLIVGDEVHNLGAPRLEACLPSHIGLRLGLSATPERYFDEEGTDSIMEYFGAILQPEFTLADAITKGALVPYNYYPILVELTPPESLIYGKLTQRIGWAISQNKSWSDNETLTSLLMRRSRLIGAATNKLPALYELMQDRLDTNHTLFYCGDGSVESGSSNYRRQLAAVTRILGRDLGYRVNTYTAETPVAEREKLQQQFEKGELQGLVAIRCLDEGVDIPCIQHAVILASTGNPRQFIQRRGRILRPHPQKQQANLFDMIVVPPEVDREVLDMERNLLRKEFKRFLEFADLAKNRVEATETLATLVTKYGLTSLS
ncbi:DNA phosphorothioation system restriction enzyme [Gloeocapsa sp. PCC 73106]|uniref:DNA phosphorothioation system restriction enzyme n=1 Tax=Gloeocapsa sp. PCC 73106 TaxID=102232 RepID=UPI0002AC8318|nr:DNA phosphorothioation system restriction enzyme [Gloeocapsa sp. PCC 73106]ELR96543.1 DNA phosphorothioation system restriction enzyme [Gloeocapsa sp. PCC 73106]